VRNEEVLLRQGGEVYPKNNGKKEGYLDWSHLALELPSKTLLLKESYGKLLCDGANKRQSFYSTSNY
jgi:hypothetical protein